ncbi:hypothetical protein [Kitasatospora sp. NPDC093806]|uniref:hypothetical protein n=1 Tax=Kitasatospora sp. NPDC093806 TaxID=3155075 RepID=UPI0034208FB3
MATRTRPGAAPVLNAVPVAVGLAAGAVVVATSRYRGAGLWPVWSAMALALTGTAGAVFAFGLRQWRALPPAERPTGRAAALITGAVTLGAVLNGVVTVTVPVHDRSATWQGSVLVGTAVLGAVPTACTVHAIRAAALADHGDTDAGELTRWLLERRQSLRSMLAGLGALVALSTLALGVAVRTEAQQVQTQALAAADATPAEYVLVFGGAGSLLVGVLYTPAALALRRQARLLAARLFPLTGTDEPERLLERAEQRARFEQLLGTTTGPFADLQADIVVLTPLLAAAVAVWLPKT